MVAERLGQPGRKTYDIVSGDTANGIEMRRLGDDHRPGAFVGKDLGQQRITDFAFDRW